MQILVEVFNQKHNPFDNEVLINWLDVEQVEIQNLDAINLVKTDFNSIPDDISDDIEFSFKLEVDCENEQQQEKLFNELTEKGYECRVLTL